MSGRLRHDGKSSSAAPWHFFVYELFDDAGEVLYVGKGSGKRLVSQRSRFRLHGREVARFKREADALAFEVRHIAETIPRLNVHPGGNGHKARRKPVRKTKDELWMESIGGPRVAAARCVYAARHWMAARGMDVSKMDEIRQVAYGPRA